MSRANGSRRKRRGVFGPIMLIIVGMLALTAARVVWVQHTHARRSQAAARRITRSRARGPERTHAVPHAPWIVNPTTGHEYAVIDAGTWAASDAAAERLGGHLVAINDAAEQAWLVEQFGPTTRHWIGLTDAGSEGEWRWVTGEPLSYTNWAEAEPNNYGAGGEDYVHMGPLPNGVWNDLGPESNQWRGLRHAIVERVPQRLPALDPAGPLRVDILRSTSLEGDINSARAMALYDQETPEVPPTPPAASDR
ncbi:hypothetical protein HN371_05785 [Candidatus Poribacteria bacterium]|jgi:hypothetical protein|nr:hypothetical protein [Candidatus Poribacteria bacterium]MBT5537227.1 hypothetical protein [Candidatus Poribacteria bacterium]MBT5711299.1 hypothetical protein [Candidatus Poribacteria bacterium]MBT7100070.1 hypothetical protein [Candidatus Poribacteria bacterium]MBT7808945.1 hypothetical protein [Candidatus Poribacteria bacterium]